MLLKYLAFATLFFSSVGWCSPEAKQVFTVFQSICMNKNSNWIAKAEEIANKYNWEKNSKQWGKQFGVRLHDAPVEPELFDVRSWTFQSKDGVKNKITIYMVAPEWPMLKANSCNLDRVAKDAENIKAFVSEAVGKEYVDDATAVKGLHRWILENTMKANVGRLHGIMLGEGKMRDEWHSMISVTEWDFPSDTSGLPHQNPFP